MKEPFLMLQESHYSTEEVNLRKDISLLLTQIGIPRIFLGHSYFIDAIIITMNSPEKLNHITKEIYPDIARMYNVSPENVERSMRHALDVVWKHQNIRSIPDLFKYSRLRYNIRPSNSEFIGAIYEFLDLSLYF